MIERIHYQNFKSWKDTGSLTLCPLTGFFGANSSGKTSLLQGLLLLKQTTESSDRNQVLEFGDENSYAELGSFDEVIFGHRNEALSFTIIWTLPERLVIEDPEHKGEQLFATDKLAFEVLIDKKNKGELSVSELGYFFSGHIFSILRKNGKEEYDLDYSGGKKFFRFIKRKMRSWPLPPPLKFYGFPDQVKAYYQNAGFLADFQLELEKLFQFIYYLGPLRENPRRQYIWKGAEPEDMGRRGQRAVDAILVSDSRGRRISRGKGNKSFLLGEYVAYWLRELQLISSFEIREIKEGSGFFQVWVRKNEHSEPVLITDVGFGVSQILPVLTLCYYVPEGSVIIIEQPEIHLHPSVQAGLADVFLDAIKIRKIQILLESHSEHLMRRLQLRLAEGKATPDTIQLYFCEMDNGQSKIKALELDEFGTIRNWPKDFFGNEFGEITAMNLAKINRLKKL